MSSVSSGVSASLRRLASVRSRTSVRSPALNAASPSTPGPVTPRYRATSSSMVNSTSVMSRPASVALQGGGAGGGDHGLGEERGREAVLGERVVALRGQRVPLVEALRDRLV